jgi:hypothetical protein
MEKALSTDETLTRVLLICGIAAAPLFIVVALIQTFTRPGFDVTRHALSLLSNGDWGWVQVLNFLITGVLIVAGAIGLKRAIKSGQGRTWGPILLGLYGVGLIGAGIFSADPGLGFPPGAPETLNISWRGILHLSFASIGFTGFIIACFLFASRFKALGQVGWAWYSLITGIILFVSFAALSSGSTGAASLPFFLAGSFGILWIAALHFWTKHKIEA